MYIKDLIVTEDACILGTLYTNGSQASNGGGGAGIVSGLPQIPLSTSAAIGTANSIWVQLL